MNQLLMLGDDPKKYNQALQDYNQNHRNPSHREDHLFEDKYIISEKTLHARHSQR
jgi:hypothetical protein